MTRPDENVTARLDALMAAVARRGPVDTDGVKAELASMADEYGADPRLRTLFDTMHSAMSATDAASMRDSLGRLGALAGNAPGVAPMMDLMPDYLAAIEAHENGDDLAAAARFSEVLARSGDLPAGNPLREAMAEVAPALNAMLTGTALPEPPPGASDAERAFHLMANGGRDADPGAGVADLRRALELTPPGHPQRPFCLASLALTLYRRSEASGSLADVDEAIGLLTDARREAGGPEHQHWSFINEMLAGLHRRRGDSAPARLAALEGLRGYTWRILLQPDPASARAVAAEAAQEAMAAASRCLIDHQPADALRALDAGRGLMLFATTELRDPCTRLIDAGHRDLADRWRATTDPSPRLREQVLEVLARGTGLLDPPDLDEIQRALGRLGADALVYLVPADAPAPGWAVIAPAGGPARYVPLPHLVLSEGVHLTAAATRDVGEDDDEPLDDSLGALCEWAWKAAMGPLSASCPAGDRVPRLVLIPMGDLARVPWQAARDPGGTYVVQRVALSQAASARMLCDSAAAEPVPVTPSGLVLADPDTGGRAPDLRSARLEAYAIHRRFYPGATYVGRRPDGRVSLSGAGTADDVRRWLRADSSEAGTMLHLASHGVMTTDRATASSHLLLAGGDLTASELVGVMASVQREVALVVLAACHTGRSIHGYDEAYSLGTMFLAGGARSVLSTQWSIPDQDTSLLMYMFHHFLTTEGRPPWDALRQAQMWMLDDDRRPPEGMPSPLRRMLADTEPARVVAWAGFVHWGQ
ncbi:CHAT domain-containing protein [Paractinoplanes atraurantiacus]|uniref:CHAT domain-containing protein n=1 Tax=Paractinoplanes atraurantiacus TaxID=1036182 RepID=A0A285HFS8_9ACTN|nr:CHAT domain-containing protein [Actinoplanes atraurantiacus]SNY34538.1 CHAT domain-containing protein [Actinoplanes atraurantiacus]